MKAIDGKCYWGISPLILCGAGMLYSISKSKKKYWKWGIAAFSIVYIAFMLVLPLVLPIFSFEKPTGEYFIGTHSYHLIDQNREEARSLVKGKHRELMIQIWYPSKETNSLQFEPYIEEVGAITAGLERALSFPAWTLSHLNLVKSHAQKHLAISNDKKSLPILIFSHGMTGVRNQNTYQIEELVSHGYIVIGIDHVYDAAATVFPNGQKVLLELNNLSGFEGLDKHMKFGQKM